VAHAEIKDNFLIFVDRNRVGYFISTLGHAKFSDPRHISRQRGLGIIDSYAAQRPHRHAELISSINTRKKPQGQESSQAGGKNMTEFSSIRRL